MSLPDVDPLGVWIRGRAVFVMWFGVTTPVAVFLYLRSFARLAIRQSVLANVAISALSWLFVVFIPVPLQTYLVGVRVLGIDCCDPISWVIPVVHAAAVCALSAVAVLLVLGQAITYSTFWSLLLVHLTAVGIAVWRMAVYVVALPPEP